MLYINVNHIVHVDSLFNELLMVTGNYIKLSSDDDYIKVAMALDVLNTEEE